MANMDDLKKQLTAIQNLIKLTEACNKLNEAGNLDALTEYGTWLAELAKDADADDMDAKDQMLDQLNRVAPKLIKFIEHCVNVNDALKDEMEGITNDIFIIDDSFFDVNNDTNDGNDRV